MEDNWEGGGGAGLPKTSALNDQAKDLTSMPSAYAGLSVHVSAHGSRTPFRVWGFRV